jgi:hypothetical protein
MKTNYFSQITALVMSLLLISSGRALSFSSSGVELNNQNQDKLENSNMLVDRNNLSVGVAIGVAIEVLNRTVIGAKTVAKTIPVNVPSEYRDIVLPKLQQAQQSMAIAQSSARNGDNVQAATAVSIAISFMGEAAASARADAGSVQAITTAMTKANNVLTIAQGKS